jgi:hypothetical protein
MTFRDRWNKINEQKDFDGIDEGKVARFVNTLYTSGVVAACDEARRDERSAVLSLLGLLGGVPAVRRNATPAGARQVARNAVALLRYLQSLPEKK